ncbi:hypothetical protein [Flavobacterium sp.]|jgi:hypothetical protein|uniref:hypothetical protein n=1 Tax=Flavobacterium sp. TaxID=239 RepID=UPI0026008C9B|nr:hypothetical protein [Flavobacterium sp.]
MKKFFFFAFLISSVLAFSQELKKPAEGKAIVYFIRSNSMGFLINFKYFDGEKYLGKFNYGKYLAYECEPGKHLFWSKSENVDFVEANLDAGKIYIIDSEPQMGAFKAGVKLVPFVDDVLQFKNEKKYLKTKERILKSITEKKEYTINDEDLEEAKQDLEGVVRRNIEKYNNRKANDSGFTQLTVEMNYKN